MRYASACPSPCRIAGWLLAGLLLLPAPARAQYLGENLRGDVALSAGNQPFPGIYVTVPFYNYDIGSLHDNDGHEQSSLDALSVQAWLPALAVVTKTKILGANYGFTVAPALFMQNVIDVPRAGLDQGSGFALYDTYYQPINLGWTTKRADFVAGYAFFPPTGDFDEGQGLGMWSHEISGGTTIGFGAGKRYSVSTLAALETHTKKKDLDIHVGTLLTLEGGLGAKFAKGATTLGLAYYGQFKVTDDSGTDRPLAALAALGILGKQKVWGFGPELTTKVFGKGTTLGLVTARYFWETGATSSFQGQALFVSFTLAKLSLP